LTLFASDPRLQVAYSQFIAPDRRVKLTTHPDGTGAGADTRS